MLCNGTVRRHVLRTVRQLGGGSRAHGVGRDEVEEASKLKKKKKNVKC